MSKNPEPNVCERGFTRNLILLAGFEESFHRVQGFLKCCGELARVSLLCGVEGREAEDDGVGVRIVTGSVAIGHHGAIAHVGIG